MTAHRVDTSHQIRQIGEPCSFKCSALQVECSVDVQRGRLHDLNVQRSPVLQLKRRARTLLIDVFHRLLRPALFRPSLASSCWRSSFVLFVQHLFEPLSGALKVGYTLPTVEHVTGRWDILTSREVAAAAIHPLGTRPF